MFDLGDVLGLALGWFYNERLTENILKMREGVEDEFREISVTYTPCKVRTLDLLPITPNGYNLLESPLNFREVVLDD